MEKELGKIKKNDSTDIIVRIDEYKGKKGLTIREYVTSERYTGFSKAGTRIPVESFIEFRDMINKVDYNELMTEPKKEEKSELNQPVKEVNSVKKPRKKKEESKKESVEVPEEDLAQE